MVKRATDSWRRSGSTDGINLTSRENSRPYGDIMQTYFLKLAEEVEPKINSEDRDLWLERLEVEHDNFRAALAWSREEAQGETGLRLAGALVWLWYHREYWSQWRGWVDTALATQESAGDRGGPLRGRRRSLAEDSWPGCRVTRTRHALNWRRA